MIHQLPPPDRLQSFRRITSCSISLSSDRSATIFSSLPFSSASGRSRFISDSAPLIPALRQISPTAVPSSPCRRMKAICASVNFDLFMVLPRPTARIAHAAKLEFSSNDRSENREAGQARDIPDGRRSNESSSSVINITALRISIRELREGEEVGKVGESGKAAVFRSENRLTHFGWPWDSDIGVIPSNATFGVAIIIGRNLVQHLRIRLERTIAMRESDRNIQLLRILGT